MSWTEEQSRALVDALKGWEPPPAIVHKYADELQNIMIWSLKSANGELWAIYTSKSTQSQPRLFWKNEIGTLEEAIRFAQSLQQDRDIPPDPKWHSQIRSKTP